VLTTKTQKRIDTRIIVMIPAEFCCMIVCPSNNLEVLPNLGSVDELDGTAFL